MALIAAHLNAGVMLVVTVYNLPIPSPPYPLPHFSSSLISVMVSVDVKHPVYLLMIKAQAVAERHYCYSVFLYGKCYNV